MRTIKKLTQNINKNGLMGLGMIFAGIMSVIGSNDVTFLAFTLIFGIPLIILKEEA